VKHGEAKCHIASRTIHSSFVNWADYVFFPALFGQMLNDALDIGRKKNDCRGAGGPII
jgi:hypothetical protein